MLGDGKMVYLIGNKKRMSHIWRLFQKIFRIDTKFKVLIESADPELREDDQKRQNWIELN